MISDKRPPKLIWASTEYVVFLQGRIQKVEMATFNAFCGQGSHTDLADAQRSQARLGGGSGLCGLEKLPRA